MALSLSWIAIKDALAYLVLLKLVSNTLHMTLNLVHPYCVISHNFIECLFNPVQKYKISPLHNDAKLFSQSTIKLNNILISSHLFSVVTKFVISEFKKMS